MATQVLSSILNDTENYPLYGNYIEEITIISSKDFLYVYPRYTESILSIIVEETSQSGNNCWVYINGGWRLATIT